MLRIITLELDNEAPRPEAEVSGRPPRGGRFRAVAPVGGGEGRRADSTNGLGYACLPSGFRTHPGLRPRGSAGCTPDRSKLFGSHGQRPWFHDVMTPR